MFLDLTFPKDRTAPGQLRIFDREGGDLILGPFDALGKSDNARALRAGNPDRDPAKSFGDTPTGSFRWRWHPPGGNVRSFGPHARLFLEGIDGDFLAREEAARERKNPYAEIMVHGGALNAAGKLRPTYGCARVSDQDMLRIVSFIRQRGATKGWLYGISREV